MSGSKMRVASRGAERAGLTDDEIAQVEAAAQDKNIPDLAYRTARKRPLLMLHVLDLHRLQPEEQVGIASEVCAWGISFPGTKGKGRGTEVEYLVNPIWWKEHYEAQIDEDEEPSDEAAK